MTATASVQAHGHLSSDAARARAILDRRIEEGRASAKHLFDRIETDAPADSIVRSTALGFAVNPMPRATAQLTVSYGGATHTVHRNALGHLAERAGVPAAYLLSLLGNEDSWAHELLVNVLTRHFHEGAPGARHLARSVHGNLRALLSDRYRRIDCRPLAHAVAESCHAIGAVPVGGAVTDTRVALKVIIPQVFEIVPGEPVCIGGEWSNSDFGNGTNSFRGFILRVMCLNGATTENVLKQVHLGARLAEDLEFSERTYQLDTKANASALKDVVKGTLGPAKIETVLANIRLAHEQEVDWKRVGVSLSKQLTKTELKAAQDHFDGPDVLNLPAGKTMWRASNAISWLANNTEDQERRIDLERVAGSLVKVTH